MTNTIVWGDSPQEIYNDPNYVINGVRQPQGYDPERDLQPDTLWGSVCSAEDVETLGEWIATAYRLADTPETRAHVKLFDEAVYQGIVSGRGKWQPRPPEHVKALRSKATPWRKRQASCPRVIVDTRGAATSRDWSDAARLSDFVVHGGTPFGPHEDTSPSAKTDVDVMCDSSHLYLRFVCHDAETGKLLIDSQSPWNGDAVEIFIDPAGNQEFRQIIVNPKGLAHEALWSGRAWHSKAIARTEITHDAWIATVAIPFSSISGGAPSAGETWRLNVCRDFRGAYELSAWNPTLGGWRQPKYFGELTFGGP